MRYGADRPEFRRSDLFGDRLSPGDVHNTGIHADRPDDERHRQRAGDMRDANALGDVYERLYRNGADDQHGNRLCRGLICRFDFEGYPLIPGQSTAYNAPNSNYSWYICTNATDKIAVTGN